MPRPLEPGRLAPEPGRPAPLEPWEPSEPFVPLRLVLLDQVVGFLLRLLAVPPLVHEHVQVAGYLPALGHEQRTGRERVRVRAALLQQPRVRAELQALAKGARAPKEGNRAGRVPGGEDASRELVEDYHGELPGQRSKVDGSVRGG